MQATEKYREEIGKVLEADDIAASILYAISQPEHVNVVGGHGRAAGAAPLSTLAECLEQIAVGEATDPRCTTAPPRRLARRRVASGWRPSRWTSAGRDGSSAAGRRGSGACCSACRRAWCSGRSRARAVAEAYVVGRARARGRALGARGVGAGASPVCSWRRRRRRRWCAEEAVRAVAGRGLEGDRYFDGAGTFSPGPASTGRDITLVRLAALERGRASRPTRRAATSSSPGSTSTG